MSAGCELDAPHSDGGRRRVHRRVASACCRLPLVSVSLNKRYAESSCEEDGACGGSEAAVCCCLLLVAAPLASLSSLRPVSRATHSLAPQPHTTSQSTTAHAVGSDDSWLTQAWSEEQVKSSRGRKPQQQWDRRSRWRRESSRRDMLQRRQLQLAMQSQCTHMCAAPSQHRRLTRVRRSLFALALLLLASVPVLLPSLPLPLTPASATYVDGSKRTSKSWVYLEKFCFDENGETKNSACRADSSRCSRCSSSSRPPASRACLRLE